MSLFSLLTKIGVCLMGATGSLIVLNVYSDNLFLYQPERDAISSETVVVNQATGKNADIAVVKIAENNDTWTCTIRAKLFPMSLDELNIPDSFRTTFVSKIKTRLPAENDSETINKDQKQEDKNQLVRNCSENRLEDPSNQLVKSTISITVIKDEGNTENYSIGDSDLTTLFW